MNSPGSPKYVIGLDYGTDSARTVIVNAQNGDEMASSVKYYPRWTAGLYCNPTKDQYRQHPLDYIEVMEYTIREALSLAGPDVAKNIVGLSFDTTGSTPVLVDEEGVPLSLTPGFEENPNAMFVLWKDHTSVKEADEINQLAKKWEIDYTQYEGGIYSSEWVWAKMLHVLREDKAVRDKAYSWVEHCDWMPALITGNTKPLEIKRSRCAAGHKAMWSELWGGLPSEEFLTALDPLLKGYRAKLFDNTYTCDCCVGQITTEWAVRLGLPAGVFVGAGAFDAHIGAVGGGVAPGILTRIIGTSTCDIMIADQKHLDRKLIPGICGQVNGSVVPGYTGLEAGQSAFGDVYAWFKNVVSWPVEQILSKTSLVDPQTKEKLIREITDQILPELTSAAMKIPVEESSVIAVDWMNGRRTPDACPAVSGSIAGLKLGSSAPRIFRALVEATAFGSKAIIEHFAREGVEIKEIIALGGIAKKSAFVMQVMADVLNRPIKIARSEQTCAAGAAMFAAVVAGIYDKVEDAQQAMGKGFENEYFPDPSVSEIYEKMYRKYAELGKFTEAHI